MKLKYPVIGLNKYGVLHCTTGNRWIGPYHFDEYNIADYTFDSLEDAKIAFEYAPEDYGDCDIKHVHIVALMED